MTTPHDDRELMRLHDGELSDDERAELEAALDDEAKKKLAGLEAIGRVLNARADADTRADGIADAVMAAIDSETNDSSDANAAGARPARPGERRRHGELPRARPANDNVRSIFAVAALAAAAAAALFMWGKSQPDDLSAARAPAPVEIPAEATKPSVPPAATASAPSEVAASAVPNTVEVASLDLGAQEGSVFYVPGDAGEGATTVVWIDPSGEKE